MITAVVLSAGPYAREFPGLKVLVRRQIIRTPADQQAARFSAVMAVDTEHFFFLDDDDGLPLDYLSVLSECVERGSSLAYTDELVVTQDLDLRRKNKQYEQAKHIQNPMLVHHLALCNTRDARDSIARLPVGQYWPEMLLYWELAKKSVSYVPRLGYIWNRGTTGLSADPQTTIAQMRSVQWCEKNP